MSIKKKLFGVLPDGREAYAYSLKNRNGVKVKICEYGATILSVKVPDQNGTLDDVVGGYSGLQSYVEADGYQGAVIGRVGNRIGNARFILEGKEYVLAQNNGRNSLHGGKYGFNAKLWTAEIISENEPCIVFSCVSEDMDEGYPGNLNVKVKYTLTENNRLTISYTAVSDKTTVVNLTNHTYFNLGGYASGSILGHTLWLDADTYLPTDSELIPTGEIRSVEGTPLDFRVAKTVGRDFDLESVELKDAGGYDHCMNFTGGATNEMALRAILTDTRSGRVMKMYTDQPCVQFYSGNFLNNEKYPFKNGYPQHPQAALCLETQKMPDSINHENFTSTLLRAREVYTHNTAYEFSTVEK